jgi:MFS family permease
MSDGMPESINWRGAIAAIATISVVGIALGITIPLLSVLMEKQGHSASMIGANTAFAGVAALMAAPFGPRIAQILGVQRAIVIMIAIVVGCFLGFNAFRTIEVWFALRFLLGFAVTALFLLSEFWISAATPQSRRGLMFGIYATVLSLGFAIGPALFAKIGSDGSTAFYVGAGIVALAIIPVLAAWNNSVPVRDGTIGGFWPFLWLVPSATAAVLVYGSVETGGFSLFPVYGTRMGLGEADAALLLTMIGLGNVLLQIPIGILSDRIADRRIVLLGCAMIGALGMVALPFAIANWWAAAAILFIWGGVVAGLYTVGLAHLSSRVPPAQLAQANAAFVFCYGIGMLAGPQLMGGLMDALGPNGFALGMGLFFTAYMVVVLRRLTSQTA